MAEERNLKTVFAERLRHYREARQMEQSALAARVNKSQQWIAKIEAGKQSVKLEDVELLANVLRVDLPVLLGSDEEIEMTKRELKRHQALVKEATEGIAAEEAKRRELAVAIEESMTAQFRFENQLERSQRMIARLRHPSKTHT